jgi:hypothetical protein
MEVKLQSLAPRLHFMRSVPFNSTCSGSKRASEFVCAHLMSVPGSVAGGVFWMVNETVSLFDRR